MQTSLFCWCKLWVFHLKFLCFLELLWKTEEPVSFSSKSKWLLVLSKIRYGWTKRFLALPVRSGTVDLQLHPEGRVRVKPNVFVEGNLSLYLLVLSSPEVYYVSMSFFTDDNTGWPQDEFVSRNTTHFTFFIAFYHTSFNAYWILWWL